MNLAEQNRNDFDAFVDKSGEGLEITGLWSRVIHSTNQQELARTMDRLTCSFSFEAQPIFLDNEFGYEITLPKIIID